MTGAKYECENYPDEGGAKGPEADVILKSKCDGMPRIAVEHTVIPLFKGQHDYVIWSYDRVEEINRQCWGKIPSDRYYLMSVPYVLIRSLKGKQKQEAFGNQLVPWIIQHARQLGIDESRRCSYQCHQITLTCGGMHPFLNGKVGRMPEAPADLETLQKEAFDIAVRHGLKKLWRYKLKPFRRFTTILILEDIAGFKYEQVRTRLTFFEKAKIFLLIDYIVVLASHDDQMIVGNLWKENRRWYSFIPANRRFNLRSEG